MIRSLAGSSSLTTKERLHSLIDELPESSESIAERFLSHLRESGPIVYREADGLHLIFPGNDPFLRNLASATEDDEPETEEERAAINQAEQDLREGRIWSHEEARRRLLG